MNWKRVVFSGEGTVWHLDVAANFAPFGAVEGVAWTALLFELWHAWPTTPRAAHVRQLRSLPLPHKRVDAVNHQPDVVVHELVHRVVPEAGAPQMLLVKSEFTRVHIYFPWRLMRIEHKMHLEVVTTALVARCALESHAVCRTTFVGVDTGATSTQMVDNELGSG